MNIVCSKCKGTKFMYMSSSTCKGVERSWYKCTNCREIEYIDRPASKKIKKNKE